MLRLREPILTIKADSSAAEAFKSIERHVQEFGFEIIESNHDKGEITFYCLHELMNMVVWHCWGDKVRVAIQAGTGTTTEIAVYGLPNLFRYKIRKGEKVHSRAEVSGLFQEIFGQQIN